MKLKKIKEKIDDWISDKLCDLFLWLVFELPGKLDRFDKWMKKLEKSEFEK